MENQAEAYKTSNEYIIKMSEATCVWFTLFTDF